MTLNRRQFTAMTGAAVLAMPAIRVRAAETTLKLGHLANEQNSWNKASLVFADEVAKLTEGRVEVQVFPNESLGKEIDLINGMQLGTADMTITGESLQNWAPKAALLAVPYAYSSLEQMDQVASGEIGKDVEAEIRAKAQIRPIAYFARGPRNLTSNREIMTPGDLNGLKLRVPNVPLFVQTWQALGAAPTPMAWPEVIGALQQGAIDGQENPLSVIVSAKLNEVQKYLTLDGHVYSPAVILISPALWNSLDDSQKAAFDKAAKDAVTAMRAYVDEVEASGVETLKQAGMQVNELTPDQKAAFRAALEGPYKDYEAQFGKDLMDRIQAEQ